VLVNSDMEVLQFRGDTGLYLSPSPGKASLNLLKMLRDGLLVGVRGALLKAKREETPIRESGLRVRSNGGYRQVDVQVVPVRGSNAGAQPHFLVLLENAPLTEVVPAKPESSDRQQRTRVQEASERKAQEVTEQETARLAQELAATREYLQSVIEQQEAANEELQSSNEEVQSANEELQSINEELETSKEEVQSANEELATVNEELQNRNAELGQSNNDFTNLLASVQLPIVMLGPDLRIRRFTPMAEKLLNLIGSDVGRPISDIHMGLGIPDLEQRLIDVMETVAVQELEVRDKQGHWYALRIRPYRTQENRIDGALLVLIDIDAIKRDQETLRRQAALLDQVSEAIFIWQLDGGITYWNRGAEQTYGFTREHALGRKPAELLGSTPGPQVYLEALQAQGAWIGELTRSRHDGTRIVVESRMTVESGGDGHALVFESDHPITARKEMEENLRAQATVLIAADRSKDEFLAILAHELRNPLAPLTNALEVVKNPHTTPEIVDRAHQIMSNQVWNMARIVDDLLDVARISQGRIYLRREVRDVVAVVRQAVEASRYQVESREQRLDTSMPTEPVLANVDALRLEQVVGNLVSNASKFSPRGGRILVSVVDHSEDGGEVEIRVKDDGIGISAAVLPRVFDLFMQEESSIARTTGGLGIGLTLVRHLIGLHGGSVEALSEGPGKGSEFVVRLPVNPRQLEGAATPEAPAAGTAGSRRVLVVDDNADGAEALAIVLRMAGHEPRIARSGAEALALVDELRPEVIFLDLGMPSMDGFETGRQIRLRPELEDTLLVAMTGYGQDASRQRARQIGFDEYLVKPAIPDVVRAIAHKSRPIPLT
jgi:two-component system CheB/CheR fusion protein